MHTRSDVQHMYMLAQLPLTSVQPFTDKFNTNRFLSLLHAAPRLGPRKILSRKLTVEPVEPGIQAYTVLLATLYHLFSRFTRLLTLDDSIMSGRGSPATQVIQPPKLPQVRSGISTRRQTSTYGSLATGRTREDMLNSPAFSSAIASPAAATKYLRDHFLLPPGLAPGHSSLSTALLHLTFTTPSITAPAADAIRSIAILIDSLTPAPSPATQQIPSPSPTESPNPQSAASPVLLEDQVTLLNTCIKELREVIDLNNLSATIITRVIDEVKEDLHSTAQYMTTTAEELVDAAKNAPTQPLPPSQAFTYADAARQKLPSMAAAKCLVQTKTIKIMPPHNDPTASFKDLDENILIKKASLTLELIRKLDTTLPEDVEFISARKTSQGHILYKVDSVETAEWLRSPEGSKVFISKFGSDVSLAAKPFPILVEFVPIHFNTDEPSALREVEHKNSLPIGSIKSVCWIKPVERRNPKQRRAHLAMDLFRPCDANRAIRDGLVVLGPRCPARKLLPEPTRCMKCQSFEGSHFARDCTKLTDTCGTCAGNHRTKDCEVSSPEQRFCANCQEPGHAAWDRECPVYTAKAKKYQSHVADARYRFYPEREDPTTWELDQDSDHPWMDAAQGGEGEDTPHQADYPRDERRLAEQRQRAPTVHRRPRPFPMDPPGNSQTKLPETWNRAAPQPTQRQRSHSSPHRPHDRPPTLSPL